jgi:hypothetical protein
MAKLKSIFVALLRGTLAFYSVAVVLLSIGLSHSHSQEEPASNTTNDTVIDPSCTSSKNPGCSELPAVCVDCDFFGPDGIPNCTYNENTTFFCRALPEAVCKVRRRVIYNGNHHTEWGKLTVFVHRVSVTSLASSHVATATRQGRTSSAALLTTLAM